MTDSYHDRDNADGFGTGVDAATAEAFAVQPTDDTPDTGASIGDDGPTEAESSLLDGFKDLGIELTESKSEPSDGHIVPETLAGYDLDTIEVPEILADSWNHQTVDAVVAEMQKAGAPKGLVRGAIAKMAELQAETVRDMVRDAEDARANAATALRQEWGAGYDSKLALARQNFAAHAASIGVDSKALAGMRLPDGGLLGDNAALTAIFAALPAANTTPSSDGSAAPAPLGQHDLENALEEIEANPNLYDANAPDQKLLVRKRDVLLSQLYPGVQDVGG